MGDAACLNHPGASRHASAAWLVWLLVVFRDQWPDGQKIAEMGHDLKRPGLAARPASPARLDVGGQKMQCDEALEFLHAVEKLAFGEEKIEEARFAAISRTL